MDAKQIKKLLIDLNLRQADIARDLNISRQAVSQEINNGKTSKRIRKHLIQLKRGGQS